MEFMIKDSQFGFNIADCNTQVLPATLPCDKEIQEAISPLILSASGWRKVFAQDGREDSASEDLAPADRILVAAMARVYARFLKKKSGKDTPKIYLGMDSRPTGPLMADIMLRVYVEEGLMVRPLFIVSAPEIMAVSGQDSQIDGFCYISASHNPLGHNGVKFGLSEGGVLGGQQAKELINLYRDFIADTEELKLLCELHPDLKKVEMLHLSYVKHKETSYTGYLNFARRVAAGSKENIESCFSDLRKGLKKCPLGIMGELNGSARSLGPDREYLEDLGVKVKLMNHIPRQIVHPIVPEGDSLELCRRELEKLHKKDPSFLLGYVPDCDGDRGNLVYYSKKQKSARILQAQEVFALSVLSELTQLVYKNEKAPSAVAVNGPTSLRIDRMASLLGARVFRSEVGEANVVTLAEQLRNQGYAVPILGEGSNGGNITFPARVRDPLNTLSALIALLSIPELFSIWCRKSGQEMLCSKNYSMDEILESLPSFETTSAFESRALMKIQTLDHGILKKEFEKIFLNEWNKKRDKWAAQWGLYSWKSFNTEGTDEKEGLGPEYRKGSETGGLKILFQDKAGNDCAYIWMRGSGTEPVFRIMADSSLEVTGREAFLLERLRSMVEKADIAAGLK